MPEVETLHEARAVRQIGTDHLDRHLTTNARLTCTVDRPRGSFAEDFAQDVPAYHRTIGRQRRIVAAKDRAFQFEQRIRRREPDLVGQILAV